MYILFCYFFWFFIHFLLEAFKLVLSGFMDVCFGRVDFSVGLERF